MPKSLLAAMAFALVDFLLTWECFSQPNVYQELILWRQSSVSLPNIGHVFIVASILGGANDFLMVSVIWLSNKGLMHLLFSRFCFYMADSLFLPLVDSPTLPPLFLSS